MSRSNHPSTVRPTTWSTTATNSHLIYYLFYSFYQMTMVKMTRIRFLDPHLWRTLHNLVIGKPLVVRQEEELVCTPTYLLPSSLAALFRWILSIARRIMPFLPFVETQLWIPPPSINGLLHLLGRLSQLNSFTRMTPGEHHHPHHQHLVIIQTLRPSQCCLKFLWNLFFANSEVCRTL